MFALGEKLTVLTQPFAEKTSNVSPNVVTPPKGPYVLPSSIPFTKHVVIWHVPSVDPEAQTLPESGSNLTLTTEDLCVGFFPKALAIQKLLA